MVFVMRRKDYVIFAMFRDLRGVPNPKMIPYHAWGYSAQDASERFCESHPDLVPLHVCCVVKNWNVFVKGVF